MYPSFPIWQPESRPSPHHSCPFHLPTHQPTHSCMTRGPRRSLPRPTCSLSTSCLLALCEPRRSSQRHLVISEWQDAMALAGRASTV
ncbi:hypothetical protein M3J09_006486 [Ascochyta lentis]